MLLHVQYVLDAGGRRHDAFATFYSFIKIDGFAKSRCRTAE